MSRLMDQYILKNNWWLEQKVSLIKWINNTWTATAKICILNWFKESNTILLTNISCQKTNQKMNGF